MSGRPADLVVDHDFMAKLHAHADAGFPPGQAPDLANFPDRDLAMGGWTRGFPRRCRITGRALADGEPDLVDEQRAAAAAKGDIR